MDNIRHHKSLYDNKMVVFGWVFRVVIVLFLLFTAFFSKVEPFAVLCLFILGGIMLWKFSRDYMFVLQPEGLLKRITYLGLWSKEVLIEYYDIDKLTVKCGSTLYEDDLPKKLQHFHDQPNGLDIKMKDGASHEYKFYIQEEHLTDFADSGNNFIKKGILAEPARIETHNTPIMI